MIKESNNHPDESWKIKTKHKQTACVGDKRIIKENNTMKYYSTLRPLFIGCTPKPEGNDRIINYDEPKFIDSIGRVAFGYFETDKKI